MWSGACNQFYFCNVFQIETGYSMRKKINRMLKNHPNELRLNNDLLLTHMYTSTAVVNHS